MSAVVYRLASDLRSRWKATSLLAAIVAIVGGVMIALAAGAHRTTTVPERYVRSIGLDFDFESATIRPSHR